MASKMAARNKCKGLLYMICYTDFMYFDTSCKWHLFLLYMFELFQDTFKCGFNGKVKVKFKVKYEK